MGTVRKDYDASFSEVSSRSWVAPEAEGALVADGRNGPAEWRSEGIVPAGK
jgi:hypothetical protein